MDNTLSFDMITQKLAENGISREQISVLHADIFSDSHMDALAFYKTLDPDNHIRMLVDDILAESVKIIEYNIDLLPKPEVLHADVITGSPGTGKSHLSQEMLLKNSSSVYVCGDELKKVFISLVEQNPILNQFNIFTDADSIHSFTSNANWNILEYALLKRKNIVLEMIGSDSIADTKMIRDMEAVGYSVSLNHVYASLEKSVYAAVQRRFDPKSTDYGRSVAINKIVEIAQKTETEFSNTVKLLKKIGSHCIIREYNNTHWTMQKELEAEAVQIDMDTLPAHQRQNDFNLGTKPWFKGANHTADLLLFKTDADGDINLALIKRSRPPFDGYYAFPGGFINTSAHRDMPFIMDIETPLEAAQRETQEEMGLSQTEITGMTYYEMPVYTDIQRDPRNIAIGTSGDEEGRWVVSHPFVAYTDKDIALQGGDDAASAEWVKLDSILNMEVVMAFDHQKILADALNTPAVMLLLKQRKINSIPKLKT